MGLGRRTRNPRSGAGPPEALRCFPGIRAQMGPKSRFPQCQWTVSITLSSWVNHSVEFKSEEGGCTNEAESYFSRLRRSEFGIHHRISGHLL